MCDISTFSHGDIIIFTQLDITHDNVLKMIFSFLIPCSDLFLLPNCLATWPTSMVLLFISLLLHLPLTLLLHLLTSLYGIGDSLTLTTLISMPWSRRILSLVLLCHLIPPLILFVSHALLVIKEGLSTDQPLIRTHTLLLSMLILMVILPLSLQKA